VKEDNKKERGEVSRRDFLVGAGAVVVGGAIGSGITYPLVKGDGGEVVTTTKVSTVSVPTTVTTTAGGAGQTVTTTVGGGETVTVGSTKTVTTTVDGGTVTPEPVTTVYKNLGLCGGCVQSESSEVDVRNNRIVRIRPMHFDKKYDPSEFNPWKITAKSGGTLEPWNKSTIPPYMLGYKQRIYSRNRILYPLKRVDWEPGGDPAKTNTQNRGKSKYKRISWDEATDLIAGEITRCKDKYGPGFIGSAMGGHGEGKNVHNRGQCTNELLKIIGGYTNIRRNPDSWQGWYLGAKHMWGMEGGTGLMGPTMNVLKDTAENTDMIVWWGGDPEATTWGMYSQTPSRWCYWFTEVGIKQVWISPECNYAGVIHADKWIPVLPNTDGALALAICYTWIDEDTYDKDFVATHTLDFDMFEDYVMGRSEDMVAKTPAWAAPLTGIPEYTIKALARAWASMTTSMWHDYGGPMIRGPYSHELARLVIIPLIISGIGKPGIHQGSNLTGFPRTEKVPFIGIGHSGIRGGRSFEPAAQTIYKPMLHEGILNPPVTYFGSGPASAQYTLNDTYPAEGCSEMHMMWNDGPCYLVCWAGGNYMEQAYRSEKLECIIVNHPWLEDDCLYADIILPANTKFENDDIGVNNFDPEYCAYCIERRAIPDVGESKSDYECVIEVAKKLGLEEEMTQGKSIWEWIETSHENSGVNDLVSWEQLQEKDYWISPISVNWERDHPGISQFYEDPVGHPLTTPSGLVEFYCQGIADGFPDDKERPPMPHWVIGGPASEGWTYDESLWGEKAKTYPLLINTNHPRWRMHAEHDDMGWIREIRWCKVKGPDGYMYEPAWLHPTTAAKYGIVSGDIVKVFNNRGAYLAGAIVTERQIPGCVYTDHGARLDEIIPTQLDRGGAVNTICPSEQVSKNSPGFVVSGYLVDIEKVTSVQMDEWKKDYPDAFERPYDPACGMMLSSWVEGGM